MPPLPAAPALRTAHYTFFDPEGTHDDALALYRDDAEAIFATVVARAGLDFDAAIPVTLQSQSPVACAARGIAYSDSPRIGVFLSPDVAPAQLRAVLAHETAHILHFAATGGGVSDLTVSEGFANWVSRPYWSAWQGFASFEDATRRYLDDGRFTALDAVPADCSIATRDVIYNERASFVGYLIATEGQAKFLSLSATRTRQAGNPTGPVADYAGIYGRPLHQLLDEWLAWVRQGQNGY